MLIFHSGCFPCRALLFISHGVGEHMGRYDKLGKYLAEKEVLVYGHDHGKTFALRFSLVFFQCVVSANDACIMQLH